MRNLSEQHNHYDGSNDSGAELSFSERSHYRPNNYSSIKEIISKSRLEADMLQRSRKSDLIQEGPLTDRIKARNSKTIEVDARDS